MKKVFLFLVSMMISSMVQAGVELSVPMLSDQLQDLSELGKTRIDGVGEVSLVARKHGNQVVIHAKDSQGKAIGKAETVVGLKETPIYVATPNGLKKITIHWGVKKTD